MAGFVLVLIVALAFSIYKWLCWWNRYQDAWDAGSAVAKAGLDYAEKNAELKEQLARLEQNASLNGQKSLNHLKDKKRICDLVFKLEDAKGAAEVLGDKAFELAQEIQRALDEDYECSVQNATAPPPSESASEGDSTPATDSQTATAPSDGPLMPNMTVKNPSSSLVHAPTSSLARPSELISQLPKTDQNTSANSCESG